MRKLLILILVTGVILDDTTTPEPEEEPSPPCVFECEVKYMIGVEDLNHVETCRAVQNLLDCVKESCKDPEISRCMYNRVNSVELPDANNDRCDPLRY